MEQRVTGLGGIFFRSPDPEATNEWYRRHLGIPVTPHGANFEWRDAKDPTQTGITVWSTFKQETKYFDPSTSEFMINYRVADLEGLLAALRAEGVTIVGEMQSYDYGKFGWIVDPEGRKIELWEPIDEALADTPADAPPSGPAA